MRRSFCLAVSGLVAFASACSDDAPPDDSDTSYNCATEDRDDEFVAGLSKAGAAGTLNFTLVSAVPAPPARGDNTWVLQVNAMSAGVVGAPVSGATLEVTPFMPDHAHGTPLSVEITPEATDGQYKLEPVNMWMPGLWETTIDATAGTDTDRVVFRFCIPS